DDDDPLAHVSHASARVGHSLAEGRLGDRRMVAGRAVADGWVAPGENWDLPGHLTASLPLPLVGTVTVWRAQPVGPRERSVVEHAAVDQQSLAGDVVGVVGGEEGHDSGNVFRGLNAAQGDAFDIVLEVLALGFAVELAHLLVDGVPHAGADDAGCPGVDGDVAWSQFLGGHLGDAA